MLLCLCNPSYNTTHSLAAVHYLTPPSSCSDFYFLNILLQKIKYLANPGKARGFVLVKTPWDPLLLSSEWCKIILFAKSFVAFSQSMTELCNVPRLTQNCAKIL